MSKKILFIDTETGGLDANTDSILTLGAVIWQDGVLGDSIELRIAEDPIVAHESALKVNGIDVEELATTGSTPFHAIQVLHNFMMKNNIHRKKIELGGHNVAFDVLFLKRLYNKAGLGVEYTSMFSHRTHCTQQIAGFLTLAGRLPIRDQRGDTVFKFFDCAPERTEDKHQALGDAIASAKSYTKMLDLVRN